MLGVTLNPTVHVDEAHDVVELEVVVDRQIVTIIICHRQ